MSRGRALRYLGWQIWDRTGPRLLACLVVAAAVCWPLHYVIKDTPPSPEQLPATLRQMHQQFAFIFVLLFAGGLVSNDRVQGFYRFYFAKPVSPLWFYAQHILLALGGMLAASAGLVAIFSVAVAPAWDQFALLRNALGLFMLAGMLCVLFSTVSKHDWLWAVVTLVVATVLRARFPKDKSTLGGALHAVLPPNHLLGADRVLDAGDWAWIAGWALGLFALALLVLWRRPLGED